MNRNSVLLSIGATLFLSLLCVNGGHAFQLDMDQAANLPTKQVSNTPSPCAGRTAATCRTQSQPGSEATVTAGSRYTRHVSNTPNPCTEGGKGRTGAPGKKRCPVESGAQRTDGSLTMLR